MKDYDYERRENYEIVSYKNCKHHWACYNLKPQARHWTCTHQCYRFVLSTGYTTLVTNSCRMHWWLKWPCMYSMSMPLHVEGRYFNVFIMFNFKYGNSPNLLLYFFLLHSLNCWTDILAKILHCPHFILDNCHFLPGDQLIRFV